MIRLLDSPYEFKRSKNLLKRKRFSEGEFAILAVTEGEGNKTGWAASMSFKMPDGSAFNSNVKGPEAHLRKLWARRASLIGKQATVRYFNLTPDGVPRFPYVVGIRDYE
jgi:ATP-dependent DNA ligase